MANNGGASPAAGSGGDVRGPRVGVSQDSLFFPLPITGGIENILQLSNQEDVKVAYKIRSTIRYRYAVRPTIGFLHPKEESIVKFLLDPNTMTVDGEAPSEHTKDAFLIDFAFAPPDATSSSSSTRGSAAEEHENAVAFWKRYSSSGTSGGAGGPPPGGVSRRRMPCVFTTKVPKSLTVHVNAAAAATLAATTADNHNLKSPSTHFSTGRAASAFEPPVTPKTSRQTTQQQQFTTPAAAAVTMPPALSAATKAQSSSNGATAVVAAKPAAAAAAAAASGATSNPPPPFTTNPGAVVAASLRSPEEIVGPVRPVKEPFLRTFLLFTIPFPIVALLLLLSLLSALVEEEVPAAFHALL